MASVDFYVGSTLLGSRHNCAVLGLVVSDDRPGTYSLTAVAHDADGGSTTSGAVSVTVSTATIGGRR